MLIIEDDVTYRHLLKEMLSNLPFQITTCANAENGMKAYLEKSYPLIVLDLMLPGMGGIEFCKKIRSLPNGEKCMIIAMTGGEEVRYFQKALDAGADDFIAKSNIDDTFLIRMRIASHLIEERKRSEEALKESEETAKVILNASPDFIILLNTEGIILECNEAFASQFKKPISELIGLSIWTLFIPEETKRYQAYHHDVVQSGTPLNAEILSGQIWTNTIATPILNSKGEVIKIAVYAHDISERKAAEAITLNFNKRFQMLIEKFPDMTYIYSDKPHASYWSSKAEAVFGLSRSDLSDQPFLWHQAIYPDDLKLVNQAMDECKRGKPFDIEYRIIDQNRNIRWLRDRAVCQCREGEYIGIDGLVTEITERKKAEMALLSAKNSAETANRVKTEFLSNMNHEINTPLNAIFGSTQILLKQSKKLDLPSQFQQYLEIIKDGSCNLAEIMANILDLAKLESSKSSVVETELNLKQLFQGMFHIFKEKARQKNLSFKYDYDSKLPAMIRSDRTLLNQILFNLIDNAIKFTPEGKSVRIKANKDGDNLVFQIIDKGIGISEEQQAKVFEMFDQADGSTTREYGGIGLGLSLTRNMIELLGGDIHVQSSFGQGSVFTIRLPLVSVSQGKGNAESNPADNQFAKDNVIIIVEDNPINIKMMEALLEDIGLDFHIATNGAEGVAKTRELLAEGSLPDIILMDMFMPIMDGLEALRLIHQLPDCADIPIVAFSADSSSEREQEAKQVGACAYITKPVDFQKLIPLLNKYLRKDIQTGLETDLNVSCLTMPEEVKKELKKGFNKLTQISIIETEKLIDQINRMLVLCEEYDTPYFKVLKQLEDPAFNADEEEFNQLLNEVLNNGDF